MRAAGLEPGIVAIGAVLNAAKKAASAQQEGVAIVQEAWDLFSTLDMSERNAFVYSSMIAALGQANLREEAVELFEEAAGHLKPWCEMLSATDTQAWLCVLLAACHVARPPARLHRFCLTVFLEF
jgi:pentatricopeptide repeat protein